MNYNGRKFKALHNSENGEVDSHLIFTYHQIGKILHCKYSGENIVHGQLLGTVDEKGVISMAYQQINRLGELRTGLCLSSPHLNAEGLLEMHEEWQWTSGDKSKGSSVLIEVPH